MRLVWVFSFINLLFYATVLALRVIYFLIKRGIYIIIFFLIYRKLDLLRYVTRSHTGSLESQGPIGVYRQINEVPFLYLHVTVQLQLTKSVLTC